ncbi:hypothetical protein [Streptomyces sp. NBC_00448]|uniref:hypothetical protein n=1 Tax=Streptomyces sp. NBC_00448 TaxID=2903652 RepID=UPI002E1D61D3
MLKGPLPIQSRAGLPRLTAVFATVLPATGDACAAGYFVHVRAMAVPATEIGTLRDA